jgi:3-deoxy-manno-octulosonate cytidylyltransferase (CMP-KDO synthetase)
MLTFHVIIPARFQSTRLPGKPLLKIGDKPMIQHVYEKAQASGAKSVTVATDDERIYDVVEQFGHAVLTKKEHPSGSDRIHEASCQLGLKEDDIIVNVQGDEPFIPPETIKTVANLIADGKCNMSTLACSIHDDSELLDPNCVKVVTNKLDEAIYFSRAAIPFIRDMDKDRKQVMVHQFYRHLGIYAYQAGFLAQYVNWPQSPLEKAESLEQLRVIENGHRIKVGKLSEATPPGVDTQQDLELAQEYYNRVQQTL